MLRPRNPIHSNTAATGDECSPEMPTGGTAKMTMMGRGSEMKPVQTWADRFDELVKRIGWRWTAIAGVVALHTLLVLAISVSSTLAERSDSVKNLEYCRRGDVPLTHKFTQLCQDSKDFLDEWFLVHVVTRFVDEHLSHLSVITNIFAFASNHPVWALAFASAFVGCGGFAGLLYVLIWKRQTITLPSIVLKHDIAPSQLQQQQQTVEGVSGSTQVSMQAPMAIRHFYHNSGEGVELMPRSSTKHNYSEHEYVHSPIEL
jgi:hypothetical protein